MVYNSLFFKSKNFFLPYHEDLLRPCDMFLQRIYSGNCQADFHIKLLYLPFYFSHTECIALYLTCVLKSCQNVLWLKCQFQ